MFHEEQIRTFKVYPVNSAVQRCPEYENIHILMTPKGNDD